MRLVALKLGSYIEAVRGDCLFRSVAQCSNTAQRLSNSVGAVDTVLSIEGRRDPGVSLKYLRHGGDNRPDTIGGRGTSCCAFALRVFVAMISIFQINPLRLTELSESLSSLISVISSSLLGVTERTQLDLRTELGRLRPLATQLDLYGELRERALEGLCGFKATCVDVD